MTSFNEEDRKWLYDVMQSKGVDTGSYDDFKASLNNDEDRQWYFDKSKEFGLDVGTRQDFDDMMWEKPQGELPMGVTTKEALDSVLNGQNPTNTGHPNAGVTVPDDKTPGSEAWRKRAVAIPGQNPYNGRSYGEVYDQIIQDFGKNINHPDIDPYAEARAQIVQAGITDDLKPEEADELALNIREEYANKFAGNNAQTMVSQLPDQVPNIDQLMDSMWYNRELQDKMAREAGRLGLSHENYVNYFMKPQLAKALSDRYGYDVQSAKSIAARLLSGQEHAMERVRQNEAMDMVNRYAEPVVQKKIDNALQEAEQQYTNQRTSMEQNVLSPYAKVGTETASYIDYYKNTDPEKIWEKIEPYIKSMANDVIGGLVDEAEAHAKEEGVDYETWIKRRIEPYLYDQIKAKFEQMALEREMPKNTMDYLWGKVQENLIAQIALSALESKARSRMKAEAMQRTDMGQGSYKPGFWAQVGGGAASMALDMAPVVGPFSLISKGAALAMPLRGTAQELIAEGMRPIVARTIESMLAGSQSLGTFEGVKGAIRGAGNEQYDSYFDKDKRSAEEVLKDIMYGTVEGGVSSAGMGATMVGKPIVNKFVNGRGMLANLIGGRVATGIDAAGATALSIPDLISGEITWEDLGKEFAQNYGTFTALGLPHLAKEISTTANGGRMWNGVDFSKRDLEILEGRYMKPFRNIITETQHAQNRQGLIEQSALGDDATKKQRDAVNSAAAQGYRDMMHSYAVPVELKAKVAQALNVPIPEYALKPAVTQLFDDAIEKAAKTSLIDALNFDYNKPGGVGDKLNKGESLNDFELTVRLFFQDDKAFNEALNKQQSGEPLTEQEQELIARHYRQYYQIREKYLADERQSLMADFEKEHDMKKGSLEKMIKDVGEGKALESEQQSDLLKQFEERLREYDSQLSQLEAVKSVAAPVTEQPVDETPIEESPKVNRVVDEAPTIEPVQQEETQPDLTNRQTGKIVEVELTDGRKAYVVDGDPENALATMALVDEQGNPITLQDESGYTHTRLTPSALKADNNGNPVVRVSEPKETQKVETPKTEASKDDVPPVQDDVMSKIPEDEKGEKLWEQAAVEDTVAALREEFGNDKEVAEMVDDEIADLESQLKELTKPVNGKEKKHSNMNERRKKKHAINEAQQKLDYWNQVKEAMKPAEQIQPVEEPSGKPAGQEPEKPLEPGQKPATPEAPATPAQEPETPVIQPEEQVTPPVLPEVKDGVIAPKKGTIIDINGQPYKIIQSFRWIGDKKFFIVLDAEGNEHYLPLQKEYSIHQGNDVDFSGAEAIHKFYDYYDGDKQVDEYISEFGHITEVRKRGEHASKSDTAKRAEEIAQIADSSNSVADFKDNLANNGFVNHKALGVDHLYFFVRYKRGEISREEFKALFDLSKKEPAKPKAPVTPPAEPQTPPNEPDQPAGPTAEQKIAQGTVKNNIGKRFGFQNQDGTRSEIVLDVFKGDDKVTVTRQDFDMDGKPKGKPYSTDFNLVDVGNSIINGLLKPALSPEEKLRKVFKVTVGDVPLIDVLTEDEQQQLLELHAKKDNEAIGNLTHDLIQSHREDIILKGREIRNSKVASILNSNASREEKLRRIRKLYQSFDEAPVYLEDESMKPVDLEEYVADLHSRVPKSGEGPIAYFSYEKDGTPITGLQDETGYGTKSGGDADAFRPWLAPKGKGMSLMKYAEQIHSQLPENIQEQFDVNAVRNAILNVFGSAQRPSDITTMLIKHGLEQAEQIARGVEEQWIDTPGFHKVSVSDNTFSGRLKKAIEQTNTEPTDGQKEDGNYKKGHVSFGGYDFVVENPEGSMRRGEADGKKWEQKMNNTYGYILGRYGKDGDHLDMFINDQADLDNFDGKVYVVDQVNPKTGEFDEHKVMYGFESEAEARDAYLSNHEEGWQGLGKITGVDKDTFDEWLDSSKRKRIPFADHSIITTAIKKESPAKPVTMAEIMQATRDKLVADAQKAGIPIVYDERIGQDVINSIYGTDDMKAQKVTDQEELDQLENGKTVKRYRAMQLIDGKLYPPMSAKVDGEMREPTEIGVWEKAEERPDLVKDGKFVLNKGQKGQGNVPAAYNPYFHTSTSGLNDQFTSAYKRPELVVVEVEIPESELTSGYKAEGAKDAVGDVAWHSGVVNGQLPADRQRQVTLSRYSKVNRIVPDSEVADMIAKQLEGTNVEVPYNVVTPALRAELEKRGVKIGSKPAGSVTEDINGNPIRQQKVERPIFVSNALRAVEGIKQEKATPEQWLAMIQKNGGLKAAEDKWTGLSDWLKEQKGSVTKQDVLDYIRKNQIQVEETPYQEYVDVDNNPKMQEFRDEFNKIMLEIEGNRSNLEVELDKFEDEMSKKYGYGWYNKLNDEEKAYAEKFEQLNSTEGTPDEKAFREMVDRYGDDFEMAFEVDGNGRLVPQMDMYGDDISDAAKSFLELTVQPINSTRLSYTTEGLENKREIALTVPTIEPWNVDDQIHFGDADNGRAVAWIRFGDTEIHDPAIRKALDSASEELYDYLDRMSEKYHTNPDYPEDMEEKRTAEEKAEHERIMANIRKYDEADEANTKKVLVIDEIQSKRHQEGRDKGYVDDEKVKAYNDWIDNKAKEFGVERYQVEPRLTDEEYREMKKLQEAADGVPDAPFEKNWHELAMKRMLRYAAENGYDKIAWTTGAQQAERYDLGKSVKRVYTFEPDDYAKEHGEFRNVQVDFLGNGGEMFINIDKDGNIMSSDMDELRGKHLSDALGKDLADKILNDKPGSTYAGNDLVIGGEGMKGFYDDILPRFMNKYGKKWGVKVGQTELPEIKQTMWSIDVTPEMKESVMQGQPMFFKTPDGQAYGFTYKGKIYLDPRIATAETPIHEYGHLWAEMKRQNSPEEWNHIKDVLLRDKMVRPFIEKVEREYPELVGKDDAFAEEVLTQFSGKHGSEKLRKMAEEIKKELGDDAMAETIAQTAIRRVKSILNEFWKGVADMMGWKYKNANQIADKILSDMLNGVNPTEKVRENDKAMKQQQEIERTLMGVHNISEDKLRKAIKQGGLANPSLAVIDTKGGYVHTDYGAISLIPKASLIDAKTGRNAGTFTADAWTPSYPPVERVMSNKGWDKFFADLKDIRKVDSEVASKLRVYMESYLDNREPDAMYWLYLHDRGLNPEIAKHTSPYNKELSDRIAELTGGSERATVLDLSEDAVKEIATLYHDYKKSQGEELKPLEERIAYTKQRINPDDPNKMRQLRLQGIVNDLEKYGEIKSNLDNFISSVNFATQRQGETDDYTTFLNARKTVENEDRKADYQAWLEELNKRYGIEEKIFDGWTPSGNKKYIPNTLENVSKYMKKQGLNGATNWSSIGNWIAKVANKEKTLEGIRSKRRNLGTPEAEHDAFHEKWSNIMHGISEKLGNGDMWTGEQRMSDILEHKDFAGYTKREYGITLSKEDIEAINTFIKEVRNNFPTGYFETKFERPVKLNEFEIAVVPEGTSEDVIKALKDAGLDVRTYKKGDEGDKEDEARRQAVMEAVNSRDDILFQKVPERKPYNLSETKKDAEGNRMYEREGSIDLWTATPLLAKARRQQAPVRLSERNMNHIISRHSDKLDTEDKVFDFLDNVFANAKILRRAKGRGMFVVVESENTDRAAIIKLMPSEDGDYYNIDSAGFYRKDKWKESEEVIADLSEPSQSDAVSDASKPQAPNDNGREPINAEAQNSSSEGKDTKNSDTFQGNDGKSSDEGQENENNSLKFREGEAQQVELGAEQRKLTPRQMRERQAYAERQWRRAHEWANDTVEKLKIGDKVTIVDSIDELEGHEKFPARKKNAKGWYDPETDSIVIVMGNHRSPSDVVKTILHEGVAHHGLRKLFGSNYDTFLDNAYKSATDKIRDSIDDLANKYDGDVRKATEEYMGKLAEDTEFENAEKRSWVHHWFNQVKQAFLDMLKSIGLKGYKGVVGDISDNELRYILWRSYKNLTEPGAYRNAFQNIEDMAMQNKLAKVVKMPEKGRIEDEIPQMLRNHNDEIAIQKRVNQMSLQEAQQAYKRIDDMMRDEQGRDLDEQFEAHKLEYREKNGLNGIGKFVADDLQRAMDKYGSGMVELRWELQDHILDLGGSLEAGEGKELYREGEETLKDDDKFADSEEKQRPLQEMPLKSTVTFNGKPIKGLEEYEEELRKELADLDNFATSGRDVPVADIPDSSPSVQDNGRNTDKGVVEEVPTGEKRILESASTRRGRVESTLAAIEQEKERRRKEWESFSKKYNVSEDGSVSLDDYVRAFNDMNTDAENKRLMERAIEVLRGNVGALTFAKDMKSRGAYDPFDGEVSISQDWITRGVTGNEKATTMLHEILHNISAEAIDLYEVPGFRKKMNKETREAVKELYAIHDALQKAYPDIYGSTLVKEMVAEYSKPYLREALKDIFYDKNANVTLWDKFKNVIKKLFGFGAKEDIRTDADKATVNAIDKLLDNYDQDVTVYVRNKRKDIKQFIDAFKYEESESEPANPMSNDFPRFSKVRKPTPHQMNEAIRKKKEERNLEVGKRLAADQGGIKEPNRIAFERDAAQRYTEDMEQWKQRHGLTGTRPTEPGVELAKWKEAEADRQDPVPNFFQYTGDKEYREAYNEYLKKVEPYIPKETDELTKDDLINEREMQTRTPAQKIVNGIATTLAREFDGEQASDTVREGVIERRRNIEELSADDSIYINNVREQTDRLGKELSGDEWDGDDAMSRLMNEAESRKKGTQHISGKDIREALPYIIEAPMRRNDIARDINEELEKRSSPCAVDGEDLKAAEQEIDALRANAMQMLDINKDMEESGRTKMTAEEQAVYNKVKVGAQAVADAINSRTGRVGVQLTSDDVMASLSNFIRRIVPEGLKVSEDTPELKGLIDSIRDWYSVAYTWLDEAGMRKDNVGYVQHYVNHVWNPKKSDADAYQKYVVNRQPTTSRNMRQRQVRTYMDGLEAGLVPQFTDVTDMMGDYSKKNILAWANKKMINDLSFIDIVERNEEGEVTGLYPMMSSKSPDLYGLNRYTYFEVPGVGSLWVYNEAADNFAQVFEQYSVSNAMKVYDNMANIAKKIELSWSGFHAGALTEVYAVQNSIEFGPKKTAQYFYKYLIKDCLDSGLSPAYANPDDYRSAAKHFVKLGATDDYSATAIQNLSDTMVNFIQDTRDALKAKGMLGKGTSGALMPADVLAQAVRFINEGSDKVLWTWLHDGLKIATFKMMEDRTRTAMDARFQKQYPDMKLEDIQKTEEYQTELNKQLDRDGQYVNDQYGGQHWELINVSPKTLRQMRRFLLSPDWLMSTQRHFLGAFGYGDIHSKARLRDFEKFYQAIKGQQVEFDENSLPGMYAGLIGKGANKVGIHGKNVDQWADMELPHGRIRRAMSSLLCYAIGVNIFYDIANNIVNAIMRKWDEEQEEEKEKQIEGYVSKYKLMYPDGMKWFDLKRLDWNPMHMFGLTNVLFGDYGMEGNALGKKTHVFGGHYDGGAEVYLRTGKQFKEFPDFWENEKGELEFPRPLINRLMGKANPNIRMLYNTLNYYTRWDKSYDDKQLEERIKKISDNKTFVGVSAGLTKLGENYKPFWVPTQEGKNWRWTDTFFPSSKGFSAHKAREYFEQFMRAGDQEGYMETVKACVMNGLTDDQIQKAIKSAENGIKAEQAKRQMDGAEELQDMMTQFDTTSDLTTRKRLYGKIKTELGNEVQKPAMTYHEFQEMFDDFADGTYAKASKANQKYMERATSQDMVEEARISQLRSRIREIKHELNTLKDDGASQEEIMRFVQKPENNRLLQAADIVRDYTSTKDGYGFFKTQLGKPPVENADGELMTDEWRLEKIRAMRTEMLEKIAELK